MSRQGDVTFEWADGEYTFRLGIGELRKLQERCDVGPYELLTRVARGTWRIDDLRETIRLGLIGGGKVVTETGAIDDRRINRLVRDYVDERPLLQSAATAAKILEAAIFDPVDDQIPKSAAAEGAEKSLSEASSPTPLSTDGDQSSDIRPEKSMTSPSGSSEPAKLDSSYRKADRKSSTLPAETNSIG